MLHRLRYDPDPSDRVAVDAGAHGERSGVDPSGAKMAVALGPLALQHTHARREAAGDETPGPIGGALGRREPAEGGAQRLEAALAQPRADRQDLIEVDRV